MPQARPLLQAALEKHFGPIATRIITLGVFPKIEVIGIVWLAAIAEQVRKLGGLAIHQLHLDHHHTYDLYAAAYGPPLDSAAPSSCPIMGDDYPDLHVRQYRQMVEGHILPFIAKHAAVDAYDELVNGGELEPFWPYLHLDQRVINGLAARSLVDPDGLAPLVAKYRRALEPWRAELRERLEPFFARLPAGR